MKNFSSLFKPQSNDTRFFTYLMTRAEVAAESNGMNVKNMERLKKLMSTMQKEVDSIQSSSTKIETEIKELQEKVMEIGGVRLKSQQSKVDGIQDQLVSLNNSITVIQIEKSAKERSLNKSVKSLEKKNLEMGEMEEEMRELLESIELERESAVEIKKQVKEAKHVN